MSELNKETGTLGSRCHEDIFNFDVPDTEVLRKACREAIVDAGCSIRGYLYVLFEPQGETHVWVIAESHVAVHTWPERQALAIDVFSCIGKESAKMILRHIVDKLRY